MQSVGHVVVLTQDFVKTAVSFWKNKITMSDFESETNRSEILSNEDSEDSGPDEPTLESSTIGALPY